MPQLDDPKYAWSPANQPTGIPANAAAKVDTSKYY
ncbi:hypothetical protein Bhyg_10306 [Pseudolycoriella hygida]|uniref:Uncharacterized protein n=1 Tax=Pseudolycoriella hygida TaxID=35572 RepID=A0A9Q0RX92_9DIPT|nr:hypothetical protein Bhyg_10306 [Pseudolycoriella hygida]